MDSAYWFQDAGIMHPDNWQVQAIRSQSKRQLWNVHRQGGKSTTAGLKAIEKAVAQPNSPVLVISPSQRQSAETVRTCLSLHSRVWGLPRIVGESAHRLELENGSRIISLPSSETTVRGFANVALLILDEASRIPDEIVAACRPMLAVSDGDIIALSTPQGRRGFFHDWWENGGTTWERTRITANQCSRISPAFLADERKALGEALYRQEYLCEFVENDEQVFPSEIIRVAFSSEVVSLWQ
ncbi:MAG: terminase family protein [Rhizomicrobium sp.]